MAEDEVRQVMISGRLIGIAGLDNAIMNTAKTIQGNTDEEIQSSLLAAVSMNNYIPVAAREAYGRAMLREFKIAQNLPAPQDSFDGLTIAVLGAGCVRCSQLESDVRDLLSEMKIAADLRHITDPKEIARFGVIGAPALVVNNKVVSVGEVPPKSKIREWIIDAFNQSAEANK
jgi:Thioredoxin domain